MTEIAIATHAGHRRPSNEDRVVADIAMGFVVVADGMGGDHGGELAAECACQAIARLARAATPGAPILEAAVAHAADQVAALGVEGPGATVAAVRVAGSTAELAHVGDVRVYLLRASGALPSAAPAYCPPVTLSSGAGLACLTRDHTPICELVERGHLTREAASQHPLRGQVSRALGRSRFDAEVTSVSLVPGDRLLVCSDGLWAAVPDEALAASLERLTPRAGCDYLIEQALAAGGGDNITVAIVHWRGDRR